MEAAQAAAKKAAGQRAAAAKKAAEQRALAAKRASEQKALAAKQAAERRAAAERAAAQKVLMVVSDSGVFNQALADFGSWMNDSNTGPPAKSFLAPAHFQVNYQYDCPAGADTLFGISSYSDGRVNSVDLGINVSAGKHWGTSPVDGSGTERWAFAVDNLTQQKPCSWTLTARRF